MMDCNELVELVTDYLEGKLPQAERVRLEGHLDECGYCVEYIAQMRATLAALGSIPPETISHTVRVRLSETFQKWKKG